MFALALSILEVIVLLLAVKIVWSAAPRGMYVSDPSIGAAIGNAANRKFENSQAQVMGMSDLGFMTGNRPSPTGPMNLFPQPLPGVRGYMAPENSIYTSGHIARRGYMSPESLIHSGGATATVGVSGVNYSNSHHQTGKV